MRTDTVECRRPPSRAELLVRAHSVKKRFLGMYKTANAGHVGCALSCAEIMVFVKFGWMGETDTLLLSKGHAAATLYSVLAEDGTLSESEIRTFYQNGTLLSAHPPANKIRGIPFATGSLGHGLSLSAGMALAARLKQEPRQIFCITSDGELDEGSVWEAALFIAHRKLDNVIWLIDRNHIQGFGRTEDVMALEPLDAKLQAFGFFTVTADGHDFDSLATARDICLNDSRARQVPRAIICSTVKGHGIGSWEDSVRCHYLPMTDDQYHDALAGLDAEHEARLSRSRHAS